MLYIFLISTKTSLRYLPTKPSCSCILWIICKPQYENTSIFDDLQLPSEAGLHNVFYHLFPDLAADRPGTAAADKNMEVMEQVFCQRAALELSICKISIHRIFQGVMKLYLYQLQVVQKLETVAYDARVEMSESLPHHY